jgi:hypothetical protein
MRLTLVQPLQIDILVISRVDEVIFIKLEVFGATNAEKSLAQGSAAMVPEMDFISFCNSSKSNSLIDLGPQVLRRRLPRTSSSLHVLPPGCFGYQPLTSSIILGILHSLR